MSLSSRADLMNTFQKITEGIDGYTLILLDLDGTILTWNKGVQNLQGYTAEEIIGQHIGMFYLPQDRNSLPEKLLNEARINGKAVNIGRRIRKNGNIFWGSIEIVAIKNERNEIIGFTNFARELKDETEIGHFWFDIDGVLHTRAGHVSQTPERIVQFRSILKESLRNGKICCITDIRNLELTDNGMAYSAAGIADIYKAVAFISDPAVDKNTSRVMDTLAGIVPSGVFTTREEAKTWIKQFI